MRPLLVLIIAASASAVTAQPTDLAEWLRDAEAYWAAESESMDYEARMEQSRSLAMRLDEAVGWTHVCGWRTGDEVPGMGELYRHRMSDTEQLVEVVCNYGASSYTAVVVRLGQDWDDKLQASLVAFPTMGPIYDSASESTSMGIGATLFAPGLLEVEGRTVRAFAKARGAGGCGSLYEYRIGEYGDATLTDARYQPCSSPDGEPISDDVIFNAVCDGEPCYDPALWPRVYPNE